VSQGNCCVDSTITLLCLYKMYSIRKLVLLQTSQWRLYHEIPNLPVPQHLATLYPRLQLFSGAQFSGTIFTSYGHEDRNATHFTKRDFINNLDNGQNETPVVSSATPHHHHNTYLPTHNQFKYRTLQQLSEQVKLQGQHHRSSLLKNGFQKSSSSSSCSKGG
jgi:hypothetical protein